jgi:hypothetical protein
LRRNQTRRSFPCSQGGGALFFDLSTVLGLAHRIDYFLVEEYPHGNNNNVLLLPPTPPTPHSSSSSSSSSPGGLQPRRPATAAAAAAAAAAVQRGRKRGGGGTAAAEAAAGAEAGPDESYGSFCTSVGALLEAGVSPKQIVPAFAW